MLKNIKNYYQVSEKLHTSAQPNVDEFKLIKQAGIETVINLARTDSPDAIANERQVVQGNDMSYINIPVDFKQPKNTDLKLFFDTMKQHQNKNCLVHCAYNWRVSCFVYLYRVIKLNCNKKAAEEDMINVWQPDETWQNFIDNTLLNQDSLK